MKKHPEFELLWLKHEPVLSLPDLEIDPAILPESCLKANASILFNNVFKVTGIRIGISRKENVFVSMPGYKVGKLDDTGKDVYQDIATR